MIYELHDEGVTVSPIDVGYKAFRLKQLVDLGCNVPEALLLPRTWFTSRSYTGSYATSLSKLADELPHRLPSTSGWAIRSSSLSEDGSQVSLAGKYVTMMIQHANQLPDAVSAVLGSDETGEEMSVIVQKRIPADLSGVIFSVNPIAPSRGPVIEIVQGSGEQLVNGQVTPWTYRNGGWVDSESPEPISQEFTDLLLNQAQLLRNELQYEVDLEFCIEGELIYWLQVRPITALQCTSKMSDDSARMPGQWFLLDQCSEPATPLDRTLDPSGLFHSEHWDTQFVGSYPYIMPKFTLTAPSHSDSLSIWEEWLHINNKFEPVFDQYIQEDLTAIPIEALWQRLQERIDNFRSCCSAYMSREWLKLRRDLGKRLREYIRVANGEQTNVEVELSSLSAGLDTITTRKHEQLNALIHDARHTVDFHLIAKDIELHPHHPWVLRFRQFIDQFGYEIPHPALVSLPLLREDPGSLMTLIISGLEAGREETVNVRLQNKEWQLRAAQLQAEIPECDRIPFMTCLIEFRQAMLRTENDDYLLSKGAASVRLLLLELGERLKQSGYLEHSDHIFYLFAEEINQLAGGISIRVHDQIRLRRRELRIARCCIPAQVLQDGRELERSVDIEKRDRIITGQTASGGVAEGIVFIVDNPLDRAIYSRMTAESIIVTSILSPILTSNIISAAAIVTETGGFLSHGAIYAREQGIPALVAVTDARKLLRHGDRVVVDANAGRILLVR